MPTETIPELISKIAAGNYTQEELTTFLEMVKNMDNASFTEAYRLLYEEINTYPAAAMAPDFNHRLERRLDLLEAEEGFLSGNLVSPLPPPKMGVFRRKWWNYAAAAVLLFFVAGYFLLTAPKKQPPIIAVQPVKKDIPAGRQGAILTLSNGRQIVLDSVANGELTRDAGVRVIRKGGELSYGGNTDAVLYNQVVTPRGRKWQLTLSDGTKVWLNAASSVRYPISFVGRERLVEVSGETYFEVAPDKSRPFKINIAGKGTIEVLGTHFDVNAYDDEDAIRTTLLEGRVKVIRSGDSLLNPGQQAVLGNGTDDIKIINDVNIDEVMAWKNGRFIFSDMDLKSIMRQLTRWYDVDVVYEGKVPEIRVGGIIHNDVYLSTVMEFLGENGVHYKIEGKKITITKN